MLSSPLPPALNQPLPAELTGRAQGWLTAYRRYPVFGPAWARGRAASVGLTVAAGMLLTVLVTGLLVEGEKPWGPFAQLFVAVMLPLLLGPFLASFVRRAVLPPRQEWIGVLACLLAAVLVVSVFIEWAAEPMKQQLAHWTGQIDAQGQRKRIALGVGVFIRNADQPETNPLANEPPTKPSLETHISTALLSFILAGGLALPRLRREREGLTALVREQELAREKTQRREAEMQLAVLAAQVEPHFLFNTLAGVRGAIRSDPARASELIDRLVDYLRSAIPRLRGDGGAQATLGGQLDIVRAYLALMQARMPRLSFSIDAASELLALPCPPLMLISLAENAVKHGVEPKVGPASIRVSAARGTDGRLAVTVADDGAGFGGSSAGAGIGLSNIRARLAQMFGARGTLALRERAGGGVQATLSWPTE
jgi:Histidine kinase